MKVHETRPEGPASQLQMLIRYKAWANELTFRSVMSLPDEEITRERQTTLQVHGAHAENVYVVDDIFRAHLEGRPHGYTARNTEVSPPIRELWQASQEMDLWYVELADRLGEAELAETVHFEFVGGGPGAMTRQDILLHLVNHATYHRGFVSDMMYQVPAVPPANDLPVFLRDVWAKA